MPWRCECSRGVVKVRIGRSTVEVQHRCSGGTVEVQWRCEYSRGEVEVCEAEVRRSRGADVWRSRGAEVLNLYTSAPKQNNSEI